MNQCSIVARISRRYAIRQSLGIKHTRTLANARRVISLSLSLDLFWRYDHPTGVDGRNQTGPTYLPVSILPLPDSSSSTHPSSFLDSCVFLLFLSNATLLLTCYLHLCIISFLLVLAT